MWKLTIEDDEGQQTSLDLARGEYSIGRAEGNSICLTERNVSRNHCALRLHGDAWTLEDRQSYNGTYVNGERVVDVVTLKAGDIVQLGDYRLELLDQRAAAAAEAQQAAAPALPVEQRRPARLVMVIGPAPGQEFPLVGNYLAVGRAEDAHVSINHSSVSRNHAELHALGDGRWEIIDLGSSNGIRINGVELRRGILEQGDAFELGDVRLRFVGAGKFFRASFDLTTHLPGFAAATKQEPRASLGRTLAKIGAIAAVVCAMAVVGWVMFGRGNSTDSATTGTDAPMATNLEAAKELLAEAKEVAKTDIDKAHAMLLRVPESSPVREEQDFKDIETKWADTMLERVSKATDPKEKRRLLNQILEQGSAVDALRRQRAADMLAELGPDPSADPNAPTVRRPPVGPGVTPGGGSLPPSTSPTTAATKTETKTSTPTTPGGEGKYDENAARRALEAKVWGGSASEAEIRQLRAICSVQGDRACRDRCTQLLKAKQGQ